MASSGVGQSLVAKTGDAVGDSTSMPVTGSTSVPVTGSTPVPVTDSASVPVTGSMSVPVTGRSLRETELRAKALHERADRADEALQTASKVCENVADAAMSARMAGEMWFVRGL